MQVPRQFFSMNAEQKKYLKQSVKDLPFSQELKDLLDSQGFETLNDLLKLEVYNWHKNIPGFNYHHQQEIVSHVMKNDLGRFLRDD